MKQKYSLLFLKGHNFFLVAKMTFKKYKSSIFVLSDLTAVN